MDRKERVRMCGLEGRVEESSRVESSVESGVESSQNASNIELLLFGPAGES